MQTALVAVEGLPYFAGGVFSYAIPKELNENIVRGARVTVPFGRGNTLRRGYVLALEEKEEGSFAFEDVSLLFSILNIILLSNTFSSI